MCALGALHYLVYFVIDDGPVNLEMASLDTRVQEWKKAFCEENSSCEGWKSESCRSCSRKPHPVKPLQDATEGNYCDTLGIAAILVGLQFDKTKNSWQYLMTLRHTRMNRHGGETCFPGGMMEEGDLDVVNTALREAKVG